MKLIRMTASFGKLDKQTLELHDGLNILTRPNEAGKSTWAAFILAMFYGIDTAERASRTNLPAKTKFKPWSGAMMEGRIDLEWEGKQISIERTSRGRVPMGEFRAFETETGLAIEGLTADNCGQKLLGVEQSVFERSAFIRQAQMGVSQDAALEKRLSALVTTGQEEISYSDSAKRLREMKNKIQHNKTGLLPQKERQLQQVEDALEKIHQAHIEDLENCALRENLEKRLQELRTIDAALQAQQQVKKLQQKQQAKEQAQQLQQQAVQAQNEAQKLPPVQVLTQLQSQIEAWKMPQEQMLPERPQAPQCPPVFAGVAEDALLSKAQKDAQEVDRLTALHHQPMLPYAAAAAALAVLAVLLCKNLWMALALAAGAIGFAVLTVIAKRNNRRREQQLEKAQEIMQSYGMLARDQFVPMAAQYHEKLIHYHHQMQEYESRKQQAQEAVLLAQQEKARLLGSAAMLGVQSTELSDAHTAVKAALQAHTWAQRAQEQAQQAQLHYDEIAAAIGDLDVVHVPQGDWSAYNPAQVLGEKLRIEHQLQSVQSQLDLNRGRVQAYGDIAALQAEKEQLRGEIEMLRMRYAAVELAEKTLAEASAQLQMRFSPQLASCAGQIFSELTDSRYERVFLDKELHISASQTAEPALRQILSLSCGTADQLYLALRLAICRLVLQEHTPLILDDALVNFDDERMKIALSVLQREAAKKQILLFSCHAREEQAIANCSV